MSVIDKWRLLNTKYLVRENFIVEFLPKVSWTTRVIWVFRTNSLRNDAPQINDLLKLIEDQNDTGKCSIIHLIFKQRLLNTAILIRMTCYS